MATQTLAEAQKLINNEIVQGIAEDIITTNPIYNVIPWTGYEGQALLVNRENALGDVQNLAVGGTITAKAASTFTQVPFTAITIIGDAELNGLVSAQSSSAGVDQMAIEVSSKAKSIGRQIQNGIATGTGVSPQLNSLHTLVDASQYTTASAGQAISFALLDELCNLVKAKDGMVDWIMMPGRTLRAYKTLVRALGGIMETMVFTMPNGTQRTVSAYENIPVFQNDWLSTTETANGALLTTGALASVYAGVWDDGSQKVGVSMIHPMSVPAGISVEVVGVAETKDETITRIKSYCNFAIFNRRGVARLTSINN